jgi:ribosomal-protein-serine acetyltransferase
VTTAPRTTPPDHLVAPGGPGVPPLDLRRWRRADVATLTRAVQASRDHLAPWMPWMAAYDDDPHAADGFVDAVDRAWAEGAEWSWGVWEDGVLVGGVGLHRRGAPEVLEIGYWTHVDHLGRGVARRAAAVVAREALAIDGVVRVEVRHAATNDRSARVPAALGFRRLGSVPRRPEEGGDSDTTVVWALDAADGEHLGLPAGSD